MTDINDIASKHLGRNAAGEVNAVYVTPTQIDPSLLVAVPRSLNRDGYGISDSLFKGFDVWHCYEFSTLTEHGMPVVGVFKIVYPSNSPNIVESKSLKLYLNSFNMAKVGTNSFTALKGCEEIIKADLSKVIGTEIGVSFFESNDPISKSDFNFSETFVTLEDIKKPVVFDQYKESAEILKTVDLKNGKSFFSYHSSLLRSNCRVTNQPDWGDVFIKFQGNGKTITEESLLQYIVSMRQENHFHEEVCELIYKRIWDAIQPSGLLVACLYTRRGGIDINPVRTNDLSDICSYFINPYMLTQKMIRQ